MDAKTKSVFLDSILYVVVGATIGSVMALAAGSFLYVAEFLSAFSDTSENLISDQWSRFVPLVFLVVAACLILMLRRTLGLKRFHSPGETIAAVRQVRGHQGRASAWCLVLASALQDIKPSQPVRGVLEAYGWTGIGCC